tara:strand:+ start:646 stop:1635 length:990 start_codon:yes stop_codon:yes gene_type:complete
MSKYSKNEATEWAWETLRGQWTTLVTPFTESDEVDEQGLRNNMRYIQQLGTTGAGCTWGMGEFWSLTREERIKVYEIVADEAAGKWPIGAHITDTSLKNSTYFAKHAESLGFSILIIAAPYFVTKTEQQVINYVKAIADQSSLAIMFYNSPQFGIIISAPGLEQICNIPNVVGVKEASFNRDLSIQTHQSIGTKAIISTPDEWILFKGKELGFEQRVMFANTSDWRFDTPDTNHYVTFINNATNGLLDQEYYDRYIRPIKTLSDTWWMKTVKSLAGSLPVPMVKYWGEIMGMAGGHVRSPMENMSAEEKTDLEAAIVSIIENKKEKRPS